MAQAAERWAVVGADGRQVGVVACHRHLFIQRRLQRRQRGQNGLNPLFLCNETAAGVQPPGNRVSLVAVLPAKKLKVIALLLRRQRQLHDTAAVWRQRQRLVNDHVGQGKGAVTQGFGGSGQSHLYVGGRRQQGHAVDAVFGQEWLAGGG